MINFIHDTAVLTKRNLMRILRTPQLLIFSSIQPVMFLLLFNYVFGGALKNGALDGGSYINFLLPGVLAQTALFGSVQTGVGMSQDISKGVVDRLSSLPISRGAIVAGRTLADAARNVFVVLVMISVGLLLGFEFHNGILSALGAIGMAVLFGFAFSWISLTIGLGVKDPETAQVAGFLWTFPLVFASSVFVPVATMPDWLQVFTKHQPITQAVDAIRYLTTGVGSPDPIWYALAWIVGIIAIFGPFSSRLFSKAS